VENNYFVLQSNIKQKKDQHPYGIPGLCDVLGKEMPILQPTNASIKKGQLEWIIPNTQINQSHIADHYSHFNFLEAGKELKASLPGIPKPPKEKKKSPKEIAELKTSIEEKLTGLGVEIPKNSTLKTLESLLEKEESKS